MNKGIKEALEWCRSKGLDLNPTKTKLVIFTKKRKPIINSIRIDGSELEVVNEIKYLGVTLDKTLTYRTHITDICTKAKMSMMQCKRAIGRTWGMKPEMVLWLYKAIIIPRITHGALVWWHKAANTTNKNELNKVQRLAALMITGAMRTTPTASLEMILGLYPLDLEIKKRATEQWFKLKSQNLWVGNSTDKEHTQIDDLYKENLSMILSNNDLIRKERIFEKKYRIHIGTREEWKTHNSYPATTCYTDGSRKDSTKLSGSGILLMHENGTETKRNVKLGKFASIFQAETFAILECAHLIMEENTQTNNIEIYSDSQAVLKALDKEDTNSALVKECKQALNTLGESKRITLAWVPGHEGNLGNEMADELAREGSDNTFIGPEPRLPIPHKITKGVINCSIRNEANKRWKATKGLRQSKTFIKSMDNKKTAQIIKQNRGNMRIAIGIITGHCSLNRHLTILKVREDPVCPGCNEDEETGYHMLAECPAYARARKEHLGSDTLDELDLKELTLKSIVRFCKSTGRFGETSADGGG